MLKKSDNEFVSKNNFRKTGKKNIPRRRFLGGIGAAAVAAAVGCRDRSGTKKEVDGGVDPDGGQDGGHDGGEHDSVPPQVTGLVQTGATTNSIAMSWNATQNADTYNIYLNGATEPVKTSITSAAATLSALDAETDYDVQVSGVNEFGEGEKSEPVKMTTAAPNMASSVSQHAITWDFDGEHQVGQYANGDWWVLGPVTITSITPESQTVDDRVINGTMINPTHDHSSTAQGYDSHPSDMNYDSSLNVAPNYTGENLVVSEGSVVSSIYRPDPPSGGRPIISDLAILTVVSEVPPSGAFRPHPFGTDKTSYWTESQLNYDILQSLPHVDNVPNLQARSEQALKFWNEHDTNWQQRAVQASNNQPVYGREIANRNGEMLLLLHLDFTNAEKRDLFVGLVQQGLDTYGRLLEGGRWVSNGGHNAGRKMPMLLAGLALGDQEIISAADRDEDDDRFQEDGQTFIVSQEDVDRGVGYTSDWIGTPEWGIRHASDPSRDDPSWSASYRWIGSAMIGHGLAARLTPGAMEAWNWPPFFAYMDRYFDEDTRPTNDTNGIQAFQRSMWEAYRN